MAVRSSIVVVDPSCRHLDMTREQSIFRQRYLREFLAVCLGSWCVRKVFGSSSKVSMRAKRRCRSIKSYGLASEWTSAVISRLSAVDRSLLLGYLSDEDGPMIKMDPLDAL